MDLFGLTPREQKRGGLKQASSIPSEPCVRLNDFPQFLQMEREIRKKSGTRCHNSSRSLVEIHVQPSTAVFHAVGTAADVCHFFKSMEYDTASCYGEATLADKRRMLAKEPKAQGVFRAPRRDTELGSGTET